MSLVAHGVGDSRGSRLCQHTMIGGGDKIHDGDESGCNNGDGRDGGGTMTAAEEMIVYTRTVFE